MSYSKANNMLKEGAKAPLFSLLDQNGIEHKLSDYKGKTIVLYFYPRDNTPGCTTEACDFRDNMARLKKKGVIVLGVSKDSADSHKKFIDKYSLNFPLLVDTELKVLKAYGAWKEKSMYGKSFMGIIRSTFIIDGKGMIKKIFSKVKVKGHVEELLNII